MTCHTEPECPPEPEYPPEPECPPEPCTDENRCEECTICARTKPCECGCGLLGGSCTEDEEDNVDLCYKCENCHSIFYNPDIIDCPLCKKKSSVYIHYMYNCNEEEEDNEEEEEEEQKTCFYCNIPIVRNTACKDCNIKRINKGLDPI